MPVTSILTAQPLPPLEVGKNKNGLWVVYDPTGMRGGLFNCRTSALKFAALSYGRDQDIVLVPESIEFDAGRHTRQNVIPMKPAKRRNESHIRLVASSG